MKIKALAVGVMLAVAGSANAAINPGFVNQDGELFLTVFSPSLQASYGLDLGIITSTLNTTTTSASFNLAADSDFAAFLGQSDLRWVVAGSSYDVANDPDYINFGVYTTTHNTAAELTTLVPDYGQLDGLTGRVASFANDINANAIQTGQPNANGSSFNVNNSSVAQMGQIGYYNTGLWNDTLGTSVISAAANVGSSIDFYHIGYDLATAIATEGAIDKNLALMLGSWTLSNNGMLTYTTGSTNPVPVPAAVWLFGSGLLGLVGIARRKAA